LNGLLVGLEIEPNRYTTFCPFRKFKVSKENPSRRTTKKESIKN